MQLLTLIALQIFTLHFHLSKFLIGYSHIITVYSTNRAEPYFSIPLSDCRLPVMSYCFSMIYVVSY